ncbi:MAG: hypothetical protein L0Y71_08915, partial [Gemmataceae bacterium]|nr:hypothetical protein [Gemmataceae bacterium]
HQIACEEPRPPRALAHHLPVELETIILKAAAKHPADRYGSAQALAADLQRFLDDKPILSGTPARWRPRCADRSSMSSPRVRRQA